MNSNVMEIDAQLCQLLGSLTLQGQRRKTTFASEKQPPPTPSPPLAPPAEDAAMSDSSDSEDSTYQPGPSPPSAGTTTRNCGCAYLQAVCAQIRAGAYSTTSGDFLETIFTHREALFAFPAGHRACAAGFTELARDLERRTLTAGTVEGGGYQWRPNWDGDHEAVVAFRHEAWVIANAL